MRALAALAQRWRTRADDLARFSGPAAEAFRECASELTAALESDDDSVTLLEASRLGGYTTDHLQRLVSKGTLANVGRKYRPRIRRVDVPMKPGHTPPLLATPVESHLSPRRRIVADAQQRGA